MDAFAPLDPDALVAHAAALRALARGLVGGDPHAAEDLVQETWARALEHPPRHTERLRGWLATVLASVAAKRRRTDARRSSRERLAARGEALTPEVELAHELEERKRVLRQVSDALLGLEEPYQSTLLLRYYEGLTPTEIARRTGAPLATVKSRLQRGLQHLRAQLDQMAPRAQLDQMASSARLDETAPRTSWLPALCALTGLDRPEAAGLPFGTATSLGAGALVMSQKTKVAAGALLLLLLGFATWRALAPDARPRDDEHAALSPPAPSRARRPELDTREPRVEPPAARVAQPTGVDARPEVPAPSHELRLLVLATDADDMPLSGARVYAAPSSCPLNAVGTTDEDGRLELRWLAQAKSMELTVLVVHDAWGTSGLRLVDVDSRTRAFAVQLRVPWTVGSSGDRTGALRELGTSLPDSGTQRGLEPDARRGLDERVVFTDPWSRTAREKELRDLHTQFARDVAAREREVELSEVLAQAARARSRPPALDVTVRGTALDDAGEPASGVLVIARHPGGSEQTRSDDRGAFAFDELEPGELRLRAGGGDHPVVESSFEGHAGLTVFWDPRLARGHELRGRVVDQRGAPPPGWVVELRVDGKRGARADTTVCASDGSFAFPDVPTGTHSVALRPTTRPGGVPALVLDRARSGRDLKLRIDERERPECSVHVRLEEAGGEAVEDGEVRLWTSLGTHGVRLAHTGGGLYVATQLPPGRYRLEASRPSAGWVERGVVLKSGADDELAPLTLERPGRLVVNAPERDAPLRWELFEDGDEVERFVGEHEATGGWKRKLRAGRFVLRAGARTLRFQVRAGEETRVGP